MKRQWYYRGSLRFCNYSCSYCPFSKSTYNRQSLKKDQAAFIRFTERMLQQKNGGAIQIVPYGEALLYPYYWEGLAALSQSSVIDAVGAQSNFSFPIGQMLAIYKQHGGELRKLRLWGTFHPEMTSVEQFIQQCQLLTEQNISYCVGAVGVPEQLENIHRLREKLPESVYLWINKMDGMGRRYTEEEIAAFSRIDAFFGQELKHYQADITTCADNRFVEADGTMRRCNISRQSLGNIYEESNLNKAKELTICTRKECSCYLAYCNHKNETFPFFWPYPAFRIPAYPKAVFFDVDGTLVPKGEKCMRKETAERLICLSNRCEIYLATSLPLEIAKRKLASVWHVIRGGVFANGGRWQIQNDNKEGGCLDVVVPMDIHWLTEAKERQKTYGFTVHVYQKGTDIYKVTLVFLQKRKGLSRPEQQALVRDLKIPASCQVLWEENCMQATQKGTGKLEGILEICKEMDYQKEEVAVFGDSQNDQKMLDYFPRSVMISILPET